MKKSNPERALKTVSYVVTILFVIIILFPLFLIAGYSVMDATTIYSVPPRLLPNHARSVGIVMDYSQYAGEDSAALLDRMQRDSAMAMYTTYFELNRHSIWEIRVYGEIDGKTVYRQRAHGMFLRLQLDYGIYKDVVKMNRATLFTSDKYKKSAEKMKYDYQPEGIKKGYDPSLFGDNELNGEIVKLLNDESKDRGLNGKLLGTSVSTNDFLLLESYLYYFLVPVYMFPTVPIIAKYSFFAFIFNTLLVMATAVVTQVGLCSLTAFGLSRLFSKKMSNILMMYFLVTMMIPFICIALPQLIMMKNWGMVNTYGAMLLPYLYPAAFFIFLFRGFFDRLPQSLFDAAQIDGASHFYCYTRICMPLSKPIIAVITLNVIVNAWGDFFWYLLSANQSNLWTINLALYGIANMVNTKTNISMGLSFMSILPVLVVMLVFSNKIKESIAYAGIKG